MKKILYFVPVALGLLTLASCSDADALFNGADNLEGMTTLKVTENPVGEDIDGITRSYRSEDYETSKYVTGDEIRVYDSKMQKYATFTHNGTIFATPTTDATEGDYAWGVFGAGQGQVSYAGWKDGKNVALIKLPAEIDYAEEAMSTEDATVVYKSALPLWGKVTKVEGQDYAFETKLSRLTAYAKVVIKNGVGGGVKKVRARALRFATAADVTAGKKNVANATLTNNNIVAPAEKEAFLAAIKTADANIASDNVTIAGNSAALATALVEDENHPLSGWFEGVLDPETGDDGEYNGLLKVSKEGSVNTAASRSTITVNVEDQMKNYTSVVYIPIVAAPAPDKYELLVFEYTEGGDNWKVLRTLSNQSITTKQYVQNMEKSYNLVYNESDIETTYQISRYMYKYNKGNGDVILNINPNYNNTDNPFADDASLDVATQHNVRLPEMYTIYIPELKSGMTVNINSGSNGFDLTNHQLVIADDAEADNFDMPVNFNFKGFNSTTNNIKIVTKRPITLAGDFSNVSKTNGFDIIASQTSALTLGTATAGFKAGKVNIAKGIAADNATDDVLPEAENETVVGAVIVNGDATAITTLTNTDGVGITINSGDVKTLQLVKNEDQTITMNGGKISTNIAAPAANLTKSFKVTVNTKGAADIAKATLKTTSENKLTYDFQATFDGNTTAASALGTLVPASGSDVTGCIFTAAQLLGASSASVPKITLQADITADASFTSPVSLSLNNTTTMFDGNGHAIKNLKQPLFETLSANVKDLSLTGVEIEEYLTGKSNIGALAKTFSVEGDDDVTVENVTVSGTKIGAKYDENGKAETVSNVGGLFGQVTNTTANKLTIKNCGVKLTDAIQGYFNLGGFIGNANGSDSYALTIEIIKKTDNNVTANKSNIAAFKKTFWANLLNDTHCGTVGNFIGAITGGAEGKAVNVIIGSANADNFATFFEGSDVITNKAKVESSDAGTGSLEFDRYTEHGNAFIGMSGMTWSDGSSAGMQQNIGASTGKLGTIKIYNKTEITKTISGTAKKIEYSKAINAFAGNKDASGIAIEANNNN